MAAAADYVKVAQQIYVSYFGRPADLFGLNDMTAALAASDAPTDIAGFKAAYSTNGTVKAIIDNFGSSTESTALYTGTNTDFITAIFQNVLNRDPLIAGLTYWVKAIENHEMTRADAATQILAAAVKTGGSAADMATVNNKVTVATNFTTAIDTAAEVNAYKGAAAAATARAMLHTVTDTSVPADFAATIATTLTTLVTGAVPVTNTSLTLNQDTLTGGAGNDVFNAGAAAVADGSLVDTLSGVDSLNGAAGSDTLNATLSAAGLVAPTMTAVENVILRVTGSATAGLDLVASTGVTSVTVANSNISTTGITVDHVGDASLAVKNQNTNVIFDNSTATTLALNLDTVGSATTGRITVDLGKTTAASASTVAITANNALATINSTTADVETIVSVAATGTNKIDFTDGVATVKTLTTTGAGSVNFTGAAGTVAFAVLKTLTVGDGGVTVIGSDTTDGNLTAVTGAGKDKLTFDGSNVKSITTGAGNDTVTLKTADAIATATVDLGAGDDSLTFSAVKFTAGAVLTGGDGTDTIGFAAADYLTSIVPMASASRAKVTGFEVLKFNDALDTQTYDVSKITGIVSANLAAGVATTKAAIISNLGAAASVTISGDLTAGNSDGTLTLSQKVDGGSDVLNLSINGTFTDDDNGTHAVSVTDTVTVTTSLVETLNVTSTGVNTLTSPTAADYVADTVTHTLALTDDDLITLNVSGDQALVFAAASTMTALVTVDGHANTGGLNVDLHLIAGTTDGVALTGSATAANTLVGTDNNDTIIGGAKADTITGGLGGDTLTGGAGNDTFVYAAVGESTIAADHTDTISDFVANTKGNATTGSVSANADATLWTGDVINIAAIAGPTQIKVGVYTNASDSATFISNGHTTDASFIYAALDSTNHKLYIDSDGDGTADIYISLPGVSTITAAAFVL